MITIEKIQRMIAFYSSAILFFVLLPILLSYSLGYKIDYSPFRIYKTGILYINSQPQGASIFINGKKHEGLTPAQVEELKPGSYNVEVRRDGYYPWEQELVVRPNMVTRADRISLFPLVQEMKRVSERQAYDFVVSDKNYIYYMTGHGLFRSDIDGGNLKRIAPFSNWPKNIIGRKFNPSGSRFMFFTDRSVYVVYLNLDKALSANGEAAKVEEALTLEEPIIDAYWYSNPNYIIVVTEKGINVAELRRAGKRNVVSLYKFDSRPSNVHYDDGNDSVYFTDTGKAVSGENATYLYRLDLRQKFFDSLIQQLLKRETEAGYSSR
jgi:hypothetical protein